LNRKVGKYLFSEKTLIWQSLDAVFAKVNPSPYFWRRFPSAKGVICSAFYIAREVALPIKARNPKLKTYNALLLMINFSLSQLPPRDAKPRTKGITMVIDKGYSIREIENFLSMAGEYIDVVKLGWGTAVITPNLKDKLAAYRNAGIPTYFGGTLFELFYIRGQVDDYRKILDDYQMDYVEVSNGSIDLEGEQKCKVISEMAKDRKVFSEVGSKDPGKILAPYQWVEMMKEELEAGAEKVIAEARESGTVGMFRSSGEIRSDLIQEILHGIPSEKILWEAPQKSQQAWFIKLLGSDVNLGNISPAEALPLETLRLGLRGDTFHTFLEG
jgi:phosphosulfolactate synthase